MKTKVEKGHCYSSLENLPFTGAQAQAATRPPVICFAHPLALHPRQSRCSLVEHSLPHIGLRFHSGGANEGHGRTASSPSRQRCCWWREALQAKAHQKDPITAPCMASTSQDSEVLWKDNDMVNRQPLSLSRFLFLSVSPSFHSFSLSFPSLSPSFSLSLLLSLSLSPSFLSLSLTHSQVVSNTYVKIKEHTKKTYKYQIKGPKKQERQRRWWWWRIDE